MPLPAASVWLWAVAAAGLPLALPFAARSLASQQAPGALATFNYAWKLVELPLARKERFKRDYHLPASDAQTFVWDKELGNYFESAVKGAKSRMPAPVSGASPRA